MAKSKIIKELANGSIDTQTALKRTKVLLQELDNDDVLRWINCEIEGYSSGSEVPEYRKISGQLYGSYFKGSMAAHMKYTHVPLPLGKMPDEAKQAILVTDVTQGIEALKRMVSESEQSEAKTLARGIPADFYPYIATCNNDPYMIITSASVELNMPQILNIFSKVESILLDILYYLEKQFGNLDELDIDTESKNEEELKEIIRHIQVIIYNDHSVRFLYKGIIIKHNKTEPTYTKTSLFLCEKRRFFMARTEKGVVTTI